MYIYTDTYTQSFLVQRNILYPLPAQKYKLKALVFQQVCLAFHCRGGEKVVGLTAEAAAAAITSD